MSKIRLKTWKKYFYPLEKHPIGEPTYLTSELPEKNKNIRILKKFKPFLYLILLLLKNKMDSVVCPLCLYFDPEIFGDFFVVACCGHMFHKQCILKILQRSMNQCPLGCSERIEEQGLRRVYGVGSNKTLPSSRKSSSSGGNPDLNVPASSSPSSPTAQQNFILNQPVDYSFKIVLLGEPGVGKTSLIRRFSVSSSDNVYSDTVNATPGCDLVRKVISIGGSTAQLIIWDTAGQETYRSIIPACVRDVQGIIFVYDITNLDTFHSIASWVNFANKNGHAESIKILVGNKSDQESFRTVDPRCGKMTADIMKISFFETSAKDAVNVEAVFRAVGAKILESEWILANDDNTWQQNSICLHEDHGFDPGAFEGLFIGSTGTGVQGTGSGRSRNGPRGGGGDQQVSSCPDKQTQRSCVGKCLI